jgi:molybdopterin molybdotransferase
MAEHQACVRAVIPRPPTRLVPLAAAQGRVLAADVIACCPLPAFDNSAVDGYAVASADVADAGPRSPAMLPVMADVPAGCGDSAPLGRGTAHRIMTGAPIPHGADAVIPVELTDRGLRNISVATGPVSGSNIRRRGEDIQSGTTALRAGTVLGSVQLGLLGALGQQRVPVWPSSAPALPPTSRKTWAPWTSP